MKLNSCLSSIDVSATQSEDTVVFIRGSVYTERGLRFFLFGGRVRLKKNGIPFISVIILFIVIPINKIILFLRFILRK